MEKIFNFFRKNLLKILLTVNVLIWGGAGIYYLFSTYIPSSFFSLVFSDISQKISSFRGVSPTPPTQATQEFTLEGEISQVNKDFLIIRKEGQESKVILTPQTLFYRENALYGEPRQAISFKDLEFGQRIIVNFSQEPDLKSEAVSVVVLFFPPPEVVR